MKNKHLTFYSDSLDSETNIEKKNSDDYIELNFNQNKIVSDENYFSLANYIKINRDKIIEMLYDNKIIKNKKIPFKLLFHIYVNYLNDDLELIFL
jgi:hypothetical protein